MPYKPGECGNPNGRPKRDHCVTSCLRELFQGVPQEVSKKWGNRRTGAQIAAIAIFGKVSRGDVFAFRESLDRVEGKVPAPPSEQTAIYQDNSRHLAVTVLGDGRLREMAIALQRALEAQGVASVAVGALGPSTVQEATGEETQEEAVAEPVEAEAEGPA